MPFHAYDNAIEICRQLKDLIPSIKRFDRDLGDQLKRAATSVVLNVAEGAKRTAGNKQLLFETAYGSANEVKGCLEIAEALGYVADAKQARTLVIWQLRLLSGLARPKQRPERPNRGPLSTASCPAATRRRPR